MRVALWLAGHGGAAGLHRMKHLRHGKRSAAQKNLTEFQSGPLSPKPWIRV